MLAEFKKFAFKGNLMDMAMGIIIGGAFGTVVKSLVGDVVMPVIGLIIRRSQFQRQILDYETPQRCSGRDDLRHNRRSH
ncbi:MAG: MscL family protein [Verrucomicrobiales bacterium]